MDFKDDSIFNSDYTKRTYQYALKHFMKFCKVDNMNDLLSSDLDALEDRIIAYLKYLQGQRLAKQTRLTMLAGIRKFYALNRLRLNWDFIYNYVGKKEKKEQDRTYTVDELKKMLKTAKSLRTRAIILLLASTGLRVGALIGLRLKDLRLVPKYNIFRVRAYSGYEQAYTTFTTSEAKKALIEYLKERGLNKEKITKESFVIADLRYNGKPLSTIDIFREIDKVIKESGIAKLKTGARSDLMTCHAFRKFTNTKLEASNVRILVKETLLGHGIKLDDSYLRPTDQELLSSYIIALDNLTICK